MSDFLTVIQEFCYAGDARFLLRLESGSGDYTKERHQELEQLTMDDFRAFVQKKRKMKND